eukprot:TRINITY_DN45222_c0_g1_i1.p1 TRINITY_DN45222_c0_g1~~TRINITY_DN45222_c0_g1_i1.p1  ORF type:complete len:159 (+),score=11.94 TRINITY_DN45222_c0_g1_i1:29-478(+)
MEDDPVPGPSKPRSSSPELKLADLEGFAIYPLSWCPHLELLPPQDHQQINIKQPCSKCNDAKENWICLHCEKILCSRYVNSHMVDHAEEEFHVLTLSFSDLSVWCYGCDNYVDNKLLYPAKNAAHRDKFGEDMVDSYGEENQQLTISLS